MQAGTRVIVPWRAGKEIGICLGDVPNAPAGVAIKRIADAPDETPALSAAMIALCRWIADYYITPVGLTIRAALPALLTGAQKPAPSRKTRRLIVLSTDLPTLMERDRVFARTARQRALFELIESLGGRSPVEHLLERLKFSSSVLKGLVDRGFATVEREVIGRDPFARRASKAPALHAATVAQRAAIDASASGDPGDVFLLRGVTGSGKTLVYIELLKRVVNERGKSAIVLVPEIALTPQAVDRFRAVFGDQVAVLHSALSDGERYDAWAALQRGERRIAVGARSAIFAPLQNVGAIIVDEEHEGSYKQGEAPRYHAREVAVMRARHEGAVVVLGSATPSLESWANAQAGKYRLLELPDRVGGGKLPGVEVVDLRGVVQEIKGDPFRAIVSEPLESALRDRLAKKQQSILLLNRRGYSSFMQCAMCGDVPACPHCAISLTYHRAPERMVCHYCQYEEPVSVACGVCKGITLKQRGLGTQQVERALSERFSSARIARMDVDTTSGKWAHADILDRVDRGEVDILLGTQMIAKGLDFPNVTLVGVIDADVGVNLPDFRASERCFQLLSQVAGRAGRGPLGGSVVVQTRMPTHHAVRFAVTHDYLSFVKMELEGRKSPPYPPLRRLANIVFSALTEHDAQALAERGAEWLRRLIARQRLSGLDVVGPAPCPVERIKSRWRWHVLVKAEHPAELTRVTQYFAERFSVGEAGREARITVDRDPVALL